MKIILLTFLVVTLGASATVGDTAVRPLNHREPGVQNHFSLGVLSTRATHDLLDEAAHPHP